MIVGVPVGAPTFLFAQSAGHGILKKVFASEYRKGDDMPEKKAAARKALMDLATAHLERALKGLKGGSLISVTTDIERALAVARSIGEIGTGE